MKKLRSIASPADLLVLLLVLVSTPISPFHHTDIAPRIPDKTEIITYKNPDSDSLARARIGCELQEMRYYLRVHNVTDVGYNLIAQYHTRLQKRRDLADRSLQKNKVVRRQVLAYDRPMVAVKTPCGYWKAGHFMLGQLHGKGIGRDRQGRIVSGIWNCDTLVYGMRIDAHGRYCGQMNALMQACGQGITEEANGCHKEGFWFADKLNGFAFESSPDHTLHAGEWKNGRFLGERLNYTTERIYGIDISRHQHEKGRKRYGIDFGRLRITSLGKRHNTGGNTFPVSFVYIKSTEGTTIRNRYFLSDYQQAKKHGLRVGAYHFFSLKSPAEQQARYFVNHTLFRPGDFPPVLDVEPSEYQIRKIGGDEVLMHRIRTFVEYVERRTGMRPILYISQMFINQHMKNADDIKQKYNVWIARQTSLLATLSRRKS